jgi:membrane protease YdiL (CAAX protease family)
MGRYQQQSQAGHPKDVESTIEPGKNHLSGALVLKLAAVCELLLAAMLALGGFGIPFGKTVAQLLLASSSLWLRGSGWRAIGLRRPANWPRTLAWGVGIGVLAQVVDLTLITPLLTHMTGHPPDVSVFRSLIGSWSGLAYWLAVTWSFAAFGEEMFHRGYLLNRAADLFGRSTYQGWVVAAILSSVVFALGHGYQGVAGMIDIGFNALIPTVAYFASGRNLWIPIIIHGTGDTLGFILIFLHRYPGL